MKDKDMAADIFLYNLREADVHISPVRDPHQHLLGKAHFPNI
jgi:hypothetical protein